MRIPIAVAASWMAALVSVGGCGSGKAPEAAKPDERVKALEDELAKTKDELAKATTAADEAHKNEAELKAKADESAALQAKLAAAVGQSGEVTTADGAVKLELVDQILFPTGEADLTPSGKDVLAKVGAALKEIGDKQIWVQGHTDDQRIFPRKPKPGKPAVAKGKPAVTKGKPVEPAKPDTNDAVLPFVTNWELSAARALTVVHYLQDDAKLDPTRLAAVAFGQYRPVSKVKAKNRRIEIVLYPRAKIAPK
ncbi:MAG TPA: OmpA family protein [Kofleriaceae bacterium]|nr:OmpA family protein [Kofleriaceae bacterium]